MISRIRGVTLIEIIVVMALAAILTVLAAPALNTVVQKMRLDGDSQAVINAAALARSEAIRQNTWVAVCAGTATGCTDNWAAGIQIFRDANQDCLFAPADLLRTSEPLDTSPTGPTCLRFASSGRLVWPQFEDDEDGAIVRFPCLERKAWEVGFGPGGRGSKVKIDCP